MKQRKNIGIITVVCLLLLGVEYTEPKAGATGIRPIRFETEVTMNLTGEGDSVSYRLTVENYGSMVCRLRYPEQELFGTTGWRMTVYRMVSADGSAGAGVAKEITMAETGRTGTQTETESIGVFPGEYRVTVSVSGSYSPDDVELLCSFTQSSRFEAEPNDTASRYNRLVPGVAVQGTASRHASTTQTDTDCYLLQLTEPSSVSVTLSHEAVERVSVAWTVRVEDVHGNEITGVQSRFSDESVCTDTVGLGAGAYIVRVVSRIRSDLIYTLTPDVRAVSGYETEFNDTPSTANAIGSGMTVTGTLAYRTQTVDTDCYRFVMSSDGIAQVLFTHAAAEDETEPAWNVRITDTDGEVLYAAVSDAATAVTALPSIGLSAGTYCIEVDSDNLYRNGTPYSVALSVRYTDGNEAEPNDTAETATKIRNGTAVTGRLQSTQDTDCYALEVSTYSLVKVVMGKEADGNANGEYKVRVYGENGTILPLFDETGWPLTNEDGTQCTTVTVTGTQTETVFCFQSAPGTVTVRVESDLHYTASSYSILCSEGLLH